MEKIRVCMAGATGWVGKALTPAIIKASDMVLSGAVSPSSAGKDIGEVLQIGNYSLRISATVGEALEEKADVLIDYTAPGAAKANILTALGKGTNCVVGTSGLSDDDYEEINQVAKENRLGVMAAGNFAISAALLLRFSTLAARYMDSWEIIDCASAGKKDSPSGTGRELAYRMSKVAMPGIGVPADEVEGLRESRGADLNGSRIHAVRLPGQVIGANVVFGKEDEKLSLSFDAGNSAVPYVEGTLLAARKVTGMKGLTRGLDMLLDL